MFPRARVWSACRVEAESEIVRAIFSEAETFDPVELWAAIDALDLGPRYRMDFPAVLDTSCIRSGLARQLRGASVASLDAAREETIRLFMADETLNETCEKLPEFADGLGVRVVEFVTILNQEWLPLINVVDLSDSQWTNDPRIAEVGDLDPDDVPTARLAANLAPCILLTHNTPVISSR
jgi:hypothetical protein